MKSGVKSKIIILFRFLLVIIILFLILMLIRLITPTEIDDITPGIPCPEIQYYNPDVLYVIPDYNDYPISFYQKWCGDILALNKTLGMHGVTHTFKEFLYNNISQEKLDFGIEEFEKCFGYRPESFKPPQLAISKENKKLIENNGLKLKIYFNQATHRVYHCSDSDRIPNRIVNLF